MKIKMLSTEVQTAILLPIAFLAYFFGQKIDFSIFNCQILNLLTNF